MIENLELLQQRYNEIGDLIIQPDVISDHKKYNALHKEYKELSHVINRLNHYSNLLQNQQEAQIIIRSEEDPELVEIAKIELDELIEKLPTIEEEIALLLVPKEPEDSKSAVVEIRAGTGGDEAAIFAGDLYRMYSKYCQNNKWELMLIDSHLGTSGGFKEIIFEVNGNDVYGNLKFESGVHRVQRVPQTETQGRVHTSAATVMIFPEAEELDVQIDMNEVRIDYFCSSGPGGQSVNTTYSAVRLTHEPTGITAQCQDQKSQHKNKEKALKVLRSRLYEYELEKRRKSESQKRNSLVSSGDRSEKIRTYNYPQSRVTDHRIGLTLYDLTGIINGSLDKLIDALKLHQNRERLQSVQSTL